jgi:hypothetical protein
MKKFVYLIIVVMLISSTACSKVSISKSNEKLVYVNENSLHSDFHFEEGYVVFRDNIVIRNISNKDIYFYMSANMNEDYGLVTERTVPACKEETLEKEQFFIKAKSEQSFSVTFKAQKGNKESKFDRLPPNDIVFEIIK